MNSQAILKDLHLLEKSSGMSGRPKKYHARHMMPPDRLGGIRRSLASTFRKDEISQTDSLQDGTRPTHSSRRLMRAMEAFTAPIIGKLEVSGTEYLSTLPKDKKIILASSHATDFDMPVAAVALGNMVNMKIADMSLHEKVSTDPTWIGRRIAGEENFVPIAYTQSADGERQGRVDTRNVAHITETLDNGQAVLIAAHNPSKDGVLPDNPGYAAVLAALSTENSVVVPVAVDMGDASIGGLIKNKIKAVLGRKTAPTKVTIGEPLSFDDPESKKAAETITAALQREKGSSDMTLLEANTIIRGEGSKLMSRLAPLLPENVRGKWGETTSTTTQ